MNKSISMSKEFEKKKNVKALSITAVITAAILAMVILISWNIPTKADPPPVEQFVEINLGSDLDGFGSDQPLLPGEGAPEPTAYTPSQPVNAVEESVRDISSDDMSNDAPPVLKPIVSNPDAKKTNSESKVVKTNNTEKKEVVQIQKPKVVMSGPRGGNGTGGNGADSYQKGGNQGDGNGSGDKGVNGGDPNGTRYTGTPRRIGAKIYQIPSKSFEDDFKESGTVVLDIVVNASGKLVSATYQPQGSSITNRNQIEIAKRRASELDYPKYDGGFRQKISMNFQVRG